MSKLYRILLFAAFLCLPVSSEGQTVSGPEVKLVNNDIFVSFTLALESRSADALKNGIEKDLKLFIDLFRVWKIWPDEFVLGKSYSRTLKADPIKKEYVATSNDGMLLTEKRFKSFESMLDWTLSVRDMKLTNIHELDPGQYFVRITVESKTRKLPPVIGYLFIFLSENEFRVVKDSAPIIIEGIR